MCENHGTPIHSRDSKPPGKHWGNDLLFESGEESDAFDIQSVANWSELRELIARCEALPASVRQAMIEGGDLAVGHLAERRLMQ